MVYMTPSITATLITSTMPGILITCHCLITSGNDITTLVVVTVMGVDIISHADMIIIEGMTGAPQEPP